jgi:hypothetical protein
MITASMGVPVLSVRDTAVQIVHNVGRHFTAAIQLTAVYNKPTWRCVVFLTSLPPVPIYIDSINSYF